MLNKALFFSITLLVALGCAKAPEPVYANGLFLLCISSLEGQTTVRKIHVE